MNMIEMLKHVMDTQDGVLLYLLAVVCILMILDFLSGIVGAIINPNIEFKSKEGINGILRKLISIAVMVAMIPVSILIPNDIGLGLLYTLYTGYIVLEFKSIIENLDKCGANVGPFKIFLNGLEKINHTEDKDTK